MLEVLHSSGRKAAFDTSLLSFGTFICSGGRKWPERKLSHPLDDILNLNTTLAPAKNKKYTWGFQKSLWKLWSLQMHSSSLEPSLSWVRRPDLERKAHELFFFAYCCPWDKILTAVIDLLATQGCLDLPAKEEEVLLWFCPITQQHLKLFRER